jgi:DNA replication and repair protein RecF
MINDLRLQSYRSYNNDAFEFGDKVNIIVGPNASGKTNLLEAILVVCRGVRRIGSKTQTLFSSMHRGLRIESDTAEGKRIVTIEKTNVKIEKKSIL